MPRPYPLLDEIKMHVFTWAVDDEWKKLPLPVREAITTVMNEMKISEALKAMGAEDERVESEEDLAKREKKRFIAVFKKKYLEYTGFEHTETIDSTQMFIIFATCKRLIKEGTDALEYLEWFFNEFMREEFNKKLYAPPRIHNVISTSILDKYIFQNKDRLRMKKSDLANIALKNNLLTLATEYLERTQDREFGKKMLEYSRGEISMKRFLGNFIALAEKTGETQLLAELKKMEL